MECYGWNPKIQNDQVTKQYAPGFTDDYNQLISEVNLDNQDGKKPYIINVVGLFFTYFRIHIKSLKLDNLLKVEEIMDWKFSTFSQGKYANIDEADDQEIIEIKDIEYKGKYVFVNPSTIAKMLFTSIRMDNPYIFPHEIPTVNSIKSPDVDSNEINNQCILPPKIDTPNKRKSSEQSLSSPNSNEKQPQS